MRPKLMVAGAICLIIGLSEKVTALDAKDLPALQAAVHGFCVQPDRKGDYLKVKGDLDAGAILKVLGVQATGKITKETWNGINQKLDQYKTDPRECAISIVKILAPLLTSPVPRAPPSSSALPSPGDADIVASIPNTFVGFAGPHHSVGLNRCERDRSFIRCWFVIEALEQQADYDQRGIIQPYTRLIDNFAVEHKLARVYLLNGRGQPQEKLNLSKGDRVWFAAEFNGGANDITDARIVAGRDALQARVE